MHTNQKISVSCPRRCPGSDEWDYLWRKCDYHTWQWGDTAMHLQFTICLFLQTGHLKSLQHTHMQTKQIVLPSAWWSTHYFHLALKCISSRKRMWRPLERESSANQYREAMRTEGFYCTRGCFLSCLGGSAHIRMALFSPNSSFR